MANMPVRRAQETLPRCQNETKTRRVADQKTDLGQNNFGEDVIHVLPHLRHGEALVADRGRETYLHGKGNVRQVQAQECIQGAGLNKATGHRGLKMPQARHSLSSDLLTP